MAVDPYSPCPCGSGQKFKWCCHKVEAHAERAHRLFENGQVEAALQVLEEGLRKEPGNAWLLTRKAVYELQLRQLDAAKETARQVIRSNPRHLSGRILLTRLVLETEGPQEGAAELQHALAAVGEAERPALASLVRMLGMVLAQFGHYPAALRHMELVGTLADEQDATTASYTRLIEQKPTISPWLKNPDRLSPVPEGLTGGARDRFIEALGWADQGLWSSAASAFELLSAEPAATPAADRNLGFCRLWLVDYPAAVAALRRAAARLGTSTEAVDLEVLCQSIETADADDQVEHVQLIWTLRDREQLLARLRADVQIEEEGSGPVDADDPESPEVDTFLVLDRPRLQAASGLGIEQVPLVVGRMFVGREIAGLETYDDGRLDGLVDRFTGLAGTSIAQAHPKTKLLDKVARSELLLSWEWRLPDELDGDERVRLERAQGAWLIREVWPKTPAPFLKGRTPLEAAAAGDAVVPLRAAVLEKELVRTPWSGLVDFPALRARLGLGPEPEVDPANVDIESLHLARLPFVPAERLDDARLTALYRRAQRYEIEDAWDHAARLLAGRPHLWERAGTTALELFGGLAMNAAEREARDEALDWLGKGREAESPAARAEHEVSWLMYEVRVRARLEKPESWVPELAVVLDRYINDQKSIQTLMAHLMTMGLVQMVPNPDQPGDFFIDSRALQVMMAEYGPRVTTATGNLGISATRPAIWTPGGQAAGGGGGIWTPGSEAAGGGSGTGGPSKLIIPGR